MFGGLMRSGKMREAMINALKIRQEKPAAKPAPKKKQKVEADVIDEIIS